MDRLKRFHTSTTPADAFACVSGVKSPSFSIRQGGGGRRHQCDQGRRDQYVIFLGGAKFTHG